MKSVFGFRVRLGNPDLDFEKLNTDFSIERTRSLTQLMMLQVTDDVLRLWVTTICLRNARSTIFLLTPLHPSHKTGTLVVVYFVYGSENLGIFIRSYCVSYKSLTHFFDHPQSLQNYIVYNFRLYFFVNGDEILTPWPNF